MPAVPGAFAICGGVQIKGGFGPRLVDGGARSAACSGVAGKRPRVPKPGRAELGDILIRQASRRVVIFVECER